MKRKFFSMMVAACAALLSFSGLTGCSGGNEEEDNSAGYVTYRQWKEGRKGFQIVLGSVTFYLTPNGSDVSEGYYTPDSNGEWNPPMVKWCRMYKGAGTDTGVELYVSYRIEEFEVGENEKSPDALPAKAYLSISFASASDLVDPDILAAFGMSSQAEAEMASSVTLILQYVHQGNGGELEGGYKYYAGGGTTPLDFNGNGTFTIGKNNF